MLIHNKYIITGSFLANKKKMNTRIQKGTTISKYHIPPEIINDICWYIISTSLLVQFKQIKKEDKHQMGVPPNFKLPIYKEKHLQLKFGKDNFKSRHNDHQCKQPYKTNVERWSFLLQTLNPIGSFQLSSCFSYIML